MKGRMRLCVVGLGGFILAATDDDSFFDVGILRVSASPREELLGRT